MSKSRSSKLGALTLTLGMATACGGSPLPEPEVGSAVSVLTPKQENLPTKPKEEKDDLEFKSEQAQAKEDFKAYQSCVRRADEAAVAKKKNVDCEEKVKSELARLRVHAQKEYQKCVDEAKKQPGKRVECTVLGQKGFLQVDGTIPEGTAVIRIAKKGRAQLGPHLSKELDLTEPDCIPGVSQRILPCPEGATVSFVVPDSNGFRLTMQTALLESTSKNTLLICSTGAQPTVVCETGKLHSDDAFASRTDWDVAINSRGEEIGRTPIRLQHIGEANGCIAPDKKTVVPAAQAICGAGQGSNGKIAKGRK